MIVVWVLFCVQLSFGMNFFKKTFLRSFAIVLVSYFVQFSWHPLLHLCGASLGFLWDFHHNSMKFLWCFYVISIKCPWNFNGHLWISKGHLWAFHWIPLGFLWESYGISMIFLLDFYDISMRFQHDFCGV